MPTESSYVHQDKPTDVYQDLQDMLASYSYPVPISWLETLYKQKFKRSLDCNSLGGTTIDRLLVKMCYEGKLLLSKDPESNERCVKWARLVGRPDVYLEIQYLLASYSYRIPISRLETLYEEKFKRSLDYNLLGGETIEQLLVKMCDEGMVLFSTDPESNERFVEFAPLVEVLPPMKSSDVYLEIQYVLASYLRGIPMSSIEKMYRQEFQRSLDYSSLGVKDINSLIRKMQHKGRVLLYQKPEIKETYVMCAWIVDSLRKFLNRNVQQLLDAHGGEIPFSDFEDMYNAKFIVKLNYNHYGLTGLGHLCKVLNLGLEEADPPGDTVIKACKIYNLRKRKKWMK